MLVTDRSTISYVISGVVLLFLFHQLAYFDWVLVGFQFSSCIAFRRQFLLCWDSVMVLYFVAASLFCSVSLLNENGLATVVGLCYLCRVGIMIFWFSNCLHICWDLQVSWFKVFLIYVDADLLFISIIVINDVIYWFYICFTLCVWCWIVWLT